MKQVLDLNRRFRRRGDEIGSPLVTWSDLLAMRCVVVLGEGGMGKTTEFRAQSTKLRAAGDFAFFCELVELAEGTLESALNPGDDLRIAEWMSSTREAVFFLDSLDETKLRGKSLHRALANLRRSLISDWARVRLVVSSRGSDWLASDKDDLEEAIGPSEPPVIVELSPLERDQFEKLAVLAGVTDFPVLWQAIKDHAAQDLISRPVDATLLAEYWSEKRRIVDLTDLIENILEKRARERSDRAMVNPLTALKGARALAGLALLKQRWSFLIPDSESDPERYTESIDPTRVLGDWDPKDVPALLRLPLFDESSYGRVRLHHRIVHEYLAAQWFNELLDNGWPYHELEGLLFRDSAIGTVVPSHLHAVAAWLAARRSELADRLVKEAPELLLLHGDSSRLPESTRRSALKAFAERYAGRKSLGYWVEAAALRRFACPALAPLVSEFLRNRDQPQELRSTLLKLVEQGLSACVEQALEIACSSSEPEALRESAIAAVAATGNAQHWRTLIASLPVDSPPKLVAAAMTALYPKYLGIPELTDLALCGACPSPYSGNDVTWAWKNLLRAESREGCYALLAALNTKLAKVLLPEKSREDLWGFELLAESIIHILSSYVEAGEDGFAPELEQALELLRRASSDPWYLIAQAQVGEALKALPRLRRHLFWLGVTARVHGSLQLDSWHHLPYRQELRTPSPSDIEWLRADATSDRSLPERLIAFDTLCRGLLNLKSLEELANQDPMFADHLRTKHEEAKRLSDTPMIRRHQVLADERERNRKHIQTANLKILEENFETIRDGTNVRLLLHLLAEADKSPHRRGDVSTKSLRANYSDEAGEVAESGWRAFWRRHTPRLRHESINESEPKDILGLVGVTLELSSSPDLSTWTYEDAVLAARYACIELNGLPEWLEVIAAAHPLAVREGCEAALRAEYDKPLDSLGYSTLLDSLTRSGPAVQMALGPVVSDCLNLKAPGSAGVATSCLQLATHVPEVCPPPSLGLLEVRCRASMASRGCFAAWMKHWIERDPEAAVKTLVKLTDECDQSSSAGELVIALLAKIPDRPFDTQSRAYVSLRDNPLVLLQFLPLIYRYVPLVEDEEGEDFRMSVVTPLKSARWAQGRLLSIALHPEQGLSPKQLLQLADNPYMKTAKDTILVYANSRASQEAARDSVAIEESLAYLYRQHGTHTLEHLQQQREPAKVSPENLLLDLVAVGQEVIDRTAVLPEGEDEISDWLLGLLRQRLQGRGVEVGDQSRGGLSASKRGAGERDAMLRYQGRHVGFFEALRMDHCNRTTIRSHLDKMPGYNLVGAAGVYVAVYYQGDSFDSWTATYTATVEGHSIPQWKLRKPRAPYVIYNLAASQRVLRFAYDTPQGEQVVFHVLLNLRASRAKQTPRPVSSTRKPAAKVKTSASKKSVAKKEPAKAKQASGKAKTPRKAKVVAARRSAKSKAVAAKNASAKTAASKKTAAGARTAKAKSAPEVKVVEAKGPAKSNAAAAKNPSAKASPAKKPVRTSSARNPRK